MCGEGKTKFVNDFWEVEMLKLTHKSVQGDIVSKMKITDFSDSEDLGWWGLGNMYGDMERIMKSPTLFGEYFKKLVLELIYVNGIMNKNGIDCRFVTEEVIFLMQNYKADMNSVEINEYINNILYIIQLMVKEKGKIHKGNLLQNDRESFNIMVILQAIFTSLTNSFFVNSKELDEGLK